MEEGNDNPEIRNERGKEDISDIIDAGTRFIHD